MSETEADIVIVGGGPVGMGLAIELGQRDVSCIVVERYAVPQPVPKGQNLTQRTMEHFYFWGVEKQIRAAAPIPFEFGIGGLTAYGELLSDYYFDWYQRDLVRPYYFTDNERLPQYTTEEILRRRAAELASVTTYYDWSVEEVQQNKSGVQVTAANKSQANTITLRGKYVVGCDGSHSMVREQAGIEQERSEHDMLMVLLVFRSSQLNELLKRYPKKSFFKVLHPELDGYWKFFGRVDTGETWFFHAPVPAGTTEDNFDFRNYVQTAVGAEFDCEFSYTGIWDLRIATAETYRKERIFIAGDAAHSHPPYGGYGINTGFEDAKNLGWKIAATLEGWGDSALLDTYSYERQPVFKSTAKDFIENFIDSDRTFLRKYSGEGDKAVFEQAWKDFGHGAGSQIHSFEPNYEGSNIILGPVDGICSAIGTHVYKARAGHHLPPQELSTGQNVFEALGDGFSLLAFDIDDHQIKAFEQTADKLNIPLTVIRDNFADGRKAYESQLILIRPDQFIAWAGNECPGDKVALLKRTGVGIR